MSYVKTDYPKIDNRGIYLWIENYAGDTVTEFKPTTEYKLLLRIKVKGKVTKKVYPFPKDKTFKKAIETVSDCRVD